MNRQLSTDKVRASQVPYLQYNMWIKGLAFSNRRVQCDNHKGVRLVTLTNTWKPSENCYEEKLNYRFTNIIDIEEQKHHSERATE